MPDDTITVTRVDWRRAKAALDAWYDDPADPVPAEIGPMLAALAAPTVDEALAVWFPVTEGYTLADNWLDYYRLRMGAARVAAAGVSDA